MHADADGRRQLPVACTLGQEDGAQRVRDWRRVLQDAGAGTQREPGRFTIRFHDRAGIEDELTRLADAERDCCAFLGWNVVQHEGEWRVEITGRDEDLRTLSFDA
jgi:hypothetical protein